MAPSIIDAPASRRKRLSSCLRVLWCRSDIFYNVEYATCAVFNCGSIDTSCSDDFCSGLIFSNQYLVFGCCCCCCCVFYLVSLFCVWCRYVCMYQVLVFIAFVLSKNVS